MAYTAALLDHLENPRNVGELDSPALAAEVVNGACGDRIRLSALIKEGRIEAIKMLAYGCAPTIAAASVLTALVEGGSTEQALSIRACDVEQALGGLPRGKKHAAELAIEALQTVLLEYSRETRL